MKQLVVSTRTFHASSVSNQFSNAQQKILGFSITKERTLRYKLLQLKRKTFCDTQNAQKLGRCTSAIGERSLIFSVLYFVHSAQYSHVTTPVTCRKFNGKKGELFVKKVADKIMLPYIEHCLKPERISERSFEDKSSIEFNISKRDTLVSTPNSFATDLLQRIL